MTELQIACFGEFQVRLAGTPLTLFQTDKNRALLPLCRALTGPTDQIASLDGAYQVARQDDEQALILARTHGDRMSEVYALIGLGGALGLQGAYRCA